MGSQFFEKEEKRNPDCRMHINLTGDAILSIICALSHKSRLTFAYVSKSANSGTTTQIALTLVEVATSFPENEFVTGYYDGPSVKEKIFRYFFHHRILGGGNIFKYIFTTVFWGEKIYLNIFSPPYFWGRKYI